MIKTFPLALFCLLVLASCQKETEKLVEQAENDLIINDESAAQRGPTCNCEVILNTFEAITMEVCGVANETGNSCGPFGIRGCDITFQGTSINIPHPVKQNDFTAEIYTPFAITHTGGGANASITVDCGGNTATVYPFNQFDVVGFQLDANCNVSQICP